MSVSSSVVWCDIPVKDLERSLKFYSAILGAEVEKGEYQGFAMGILPYKEGIGGCLYTSEKDEPSPKGPLVYLNANGRLDEALSVVEKNGGKILIPKESIGEHGFRGVILDSEGNRIALHSVE